MSRFTPDFLRRLTDSVDLADVMGSDVQMTSAGAQKKCICPFHVETAPSMMVYPDHYYCYGCQAHGTAIDYLMKARGLSFRETVETLASLAGIPLPDDDGTDNPEQRDPNYKILHTLKAAASGYQSVLLSPEGEPGRKLLTERGIDGDSILRFCLGYAPDTFLTLCGREFKTAKRLNWETLMDAGLAVKTQSGKGCRDFFRNRIIFPIMNGRGDILGFGGRRLAGEGPKYLNTAETAVYKKGESLFGLFQARTAIRRTNSLIIVEGYFDAITISQAGLEHVVAPCGTAITKQQIEMATSLSRSIFCCFDGDAAGRKASWRAARMFAEAVTDQHEVRLCRLPVGHDPDSLIHQEGIEAFQTCLDSAPTLGSYLIEEITRGANIPEKRARSLAVAKEVIASFANAPSLGRFMQQELARAMGLTEEDLLSLMSTIDNQVTEPHGNRAQHEVVDAENALPCPCCGGKAVLNTYIRHQQKKYRITCGTCRLSTPAQDAIEMVEVVWNRRPGVEQQEEKAAAYEGEKGASLDEMESQQAEVVDEGVIVA
jgi:DNA primase